MLSLNTAEGKHLDYYWFYTPRNLNAQSSSWNTYCATGYNANDCTVTRRPSSVAYNNTYVANATLTLVYAGYEYSNTKYWQK